MRRFISLILSLSLIFSLSVMLFSCGDDDTTDGGANVQTPPDDSTEDSIFLPEYKDYGRGTIDFDEIIYSEPDYDGIRAKISALSNVMKGDGEKSIESIKTAVEEIEADFLHFRTMGAYAKIMQSRDLSELFWDEQYTRISTEYRDISSQLRTMLILMAGSDIAEALEEEVFGEGFVEQYRDSEAYSDYLVELMTRESELVADYSAISMSSVTITYKDVSATAEEILQYYKDIYGEGSTTFLSITTAVASIYTEEATKISEEIFIELTRIRSLIAKESGYLNYRDYAYENLPHEYPCTDIYNFINGTREYILPVYVTLASTVFYPYTKTHTASNIDTVTLINTLHSVMSELDPEMLSAYEYMLQHGLYSVEVSNQNRLNASFTTYLDTYSAPYVFVSGTGKIGDITTLAHEFGHFYDFYINDGESASLDISEISSQALEYLTILALSGEIDESDVVYLRYTTLENAMITIIQSALFALYEEYIYTLPYEGITRENLDSLVEEAARAIGLYSSGLKSLGDVIYPQTVNTPFYMQSYATSLAAALEIYFAEEENAGDGAKMYKTIVDRREGDFTFPEALEMAGIPSIFTKDYLKRLADLIHFNVLGAHYYKNHTSNTSLKYAA